jgi:hypothetical protein
MTVVLFKGTKLTVKYAGLGKKSKTDVGGANLKNLSGSPIRLKFDMKALIYIL